MEKRYDAFTNTISSIYQSIQKIRAHEMDKFGLQTGHATCLHHLYINPEGLTQKELGVLCDLDKAAISRYISVLKEKGYLKDTGSEDKRYKLRISLTDAGMEAAKEIDQMIFRAVAAGSADMDDNERRVFYEKLRQISGNLRKYLKRLENGQETSC